eukprot:scaffold5770_cov61-Phaeocystis_antarctica.AAC.1
MWGRSVQVLGRRSKHARQLRAWRLRGRCCGRLGCASATKGGSGGVLKWSRKDLASLARGGPCSALLIEASRAAGVRL